MKEIRVILEEVRSVIVKGWCNSGSKDTDGYPVEFYDTDAVHHSLWNALQLVIRNEEAETRSAIMNQVTKLWIAALGHGTEYSRDTIATVANWVHHWDRKVEEILEVLDSCLAFIGPNVDEDMEVSSLILRAKNLVLSGWCQNNCRAVDGRIAYATQTDTNRFTLMGALRRASNGNAEKLATAEIRVRRTAGNADLYVWNDQAGRTQGEVVRVLVLSAGKIVPTRLEEKPDPVRMFREIRALIASGWDQDHTKDIDGRKVNAYDPKAVKFTLTGAMLCALKLEPITEYQHLVRLLEIQTGGQNIALWHDRANRVQQDVLALLDRTIEAAAGPKPPAPISIRAQQPWETLEVGSVVCLPGDHRNAVFVHQSSTNKYFLTKPQGSDTIIKRMR